MRRQHAEIAVAGNAAAFRFRLRALGVADLPHDEALRRFADADPARFHAEIAAFAGLMPPPSSARLLAAVAILLLDYDLRPDDRLLVAGLPAWPFDAAPRLGIALVVAKDATPATLRAAARAADATVVAAPDAWLAAAGFDAAPQAMPRGLYRLTGASSPRIVGMAAEAARQAVAFAKRPRWRHIQAMLRRKLLSLFILPLLATPLLALPLAQMPLVQEARAAVALPGFQPDAAERADLVRIEAYLNGQRALKAHFLQVAPNGAVTQGTAWLERPGRMRFQYDPPSPLLLVAGHGLVVFHDAELNQTTNIPIGQTPLGILLADHVTLSGDVTVTGMQLLPGQIQVTLIRTASPGDGSLTLVFSDDPLALKQWSVVDAQRQETRVTLYNVELGGTFDPKLFDFVDPRFFHSYGRGGGG